MAFTVCYKDRFTNFHLMICRLVRIKTDVNVGHPEAIRVVLNLSLKQFTIYTYSMNFRVVTNQ
jgi:hypothetical protein